MVYLYYLLLVKFSAQFKKNSISPFIEKLSKFGIFLGVFILIISFSLLNGFIHELNNRVISIIPHGEIVSLDKRFYNWKNIYKKLKSCSDIISIEPYITTISLIQNTQGIKSVQIRGIDFSNPTRIKKLSQFIDINTLKKIKNNKNQIIIGKNIAEYLSLKKNDWINIIIPKYSKHYTIFHAEYISMQVIDFFKMNGIADSTLALVPILDLKKYVKNKSNSTGLEIFIKNPFNSDQVFKQIKIQLPNNIVIKNWSDNYGYIYRDLQLVRMVIFLTMIFIIIISCLNISSITLFNISKKINSIAILKTLGISNLIINITFIMYSLYSVLKTGLQSLLFSIVLIYNYKFLFINIEKLLGKKLLSNNIYFIDFIPMSISYVNILVIFSILVVIGILSSCYPAYYASKIIPAEVLKTR